MHHLRLKSGIEKARSYMKSGMTWPEISSALAEQGYSGQEIQEIQENSNPSNNEGIGDTPESNGTIQEPSTVPEGKTKNLIYEEWRVEPQYKDVVDALGVVIGRKLTGFDKSGSKPVRITSITPERAEYLNQQSENSLLRLYEVEA